MLLAGVIIGLMVGLALAGAILSSACNLVRVQPPEYFFAMAICFMLTMILVVVQVAVSVFSAVGAGIPFMSLFTNLKTAADYQHLFQRGSTITMILTPFICAGVYSVALESCSFIRGLFVWFAQFIVIAMFCAAIYGLLVVLGLKAF
jgi:hypothetical protein